MKNLSFGELKYLLHCDPVKGVLIRNSTGKIAGGYRPDGYYTVSVNNKRYLGHRLIYMLWYGLDYNDLPEVIDHIDGNPSNNKITNLRACESNKDNLRNTKPQEGTSKYKGVRLHKEGKWTAQITVDRKSIYLGSFDEELDAAEAYNRAAKEYFGDYARAN